jgi:hypothetical protein
MGDMVNAASMTVTAVATLVLAVYTYRLFDESRKQRDLATRPDIGIYLDPGQLSHNLLYLIIHNIGQGPAYDITFLIDPSNAGWVHNDGQEFSLRNIAMLRDGLEYLPPGIERRILYGPYNELPDTPVRLTVTYNRKEQAKTQPEFSESFTLDRKRFEGLLHSTPYERQVLRAIEATANNLKIIAQEVKRANRDDLRNEAPEFMQSTLKFDELERKYYQGDLTLAELLEEVDSPRRMVRMRWWLREKLRRLRH